MKLFRYLLLLILPILAILGMSLRDDPVKTPPHYTSFKPGQLWLDNNGVFINAHGGGLLYFRKTYWWYGEHKIEGPRGNSAQVGVHCYSSKDLYNWKDEGIALKVIENDQHELAKGCILERPKVIYNNKTKKFVMWFHLELKGKGYAAARSGVAVSDNPAGPFTYLASYRINANTLPLNFEPQDTLKQKDNFFVRDLKTGQMARDMNLFVDDDGKAYHIYSSEENRTMQISQLTDDWLRPSGKYVRIFKNLSREAPALFKKGSKYYLITSACTGWAPNAAMVAIADQVMGTWTTLNNPCTGPDAELTFKGQSTCVVPVQGMKNAFIFMADLWRPRNAIDGRYLWLPVNFDGDKVVIPWLDEWDLSYFKHREKN